MSRPKRSNWSKITFTLADDVQTALRVQAAREGVEIGILADRILRATLSPVIEQERLVNKELSILPLPIAPRTPRTLAIQPVSSSSPSPGVANSESHQEDEDTEFTDPALRAEYEARFMEEVFAYARSSIGWAKFIKHLDDSIPLIYPPEPSTIVINNIEKEIFRWVANGRIHSDWKPWVCNALDDKECFVPSIFSNRLSPDDFFEWEQPEATTKGIAEDIQQKADDIDLIK